MKRMTLSVFVHSLAVAGLLLLPSLGQAETMYAVTAPTTGNSILYTIDTTTGVRTTVGDTGAKFLSSLAAAPDGTLYSVESPDATDQVLNQLYTINTTTGAATNLGTIALDFKPAGSLTTPHFEGLAFEASTGKLIGDSKPLNAATGIHSLYRIDPATLVGTKIIDTAMIESEAMDFGPDGGMYFRGNSTQLTTLDPVTGFPVKQINGFTTTKSIAFDSTGTLWSIDNTPRGTAGGPWTLQTVNLSSGVGTNVFSSTDYRNIAGIEFLTPVPVPAAVWLFGSGLAAMVGFARRGMKNGEASFVKRQW